jgi:hypothetical protein
VIAVADLIIAIDPVASMRPEDVCMFTGQVPCRGRAVTLRPSLVGPRARNFLGEPNGEPRVAGIRQCRAA